MAFSIATKFMLEIICMLLIASTLPLHAVHFDVLHDPMVGELFFFIHIFLFGSPHAPLGLHSFRPPRLYDSQT